MKLGRHHKASHKIQPSHANREQQLGLLAIQEGNLQQALMHMNRALGIEKNVPHFYLNRGQVFILLKDYDSAVEDFKHAIRLQHDYAEAYGNIGVALTQMQKTVEGIGHLEKAVRLKPDYEEAHLNLAVLYSQDNLPEKAIPHFEKALQINPEHAEAHTSLGVLFVNMGRIEDAIVHFEIVAQLRPDHAQSCSNLANALNKAGRFEESIAFHEKAILLNPKCPETYFNLGNALEKTERWHEAILAYEYALVLRPNFSKAYANMGLVFDKQNRIPEALKCYEKSLTLAPDNPEVAFNKALCLLKSGDLQQGWRTFESRLKVNYFQPNTYDFPKPRWQGECLHGKTLFIHFEYGFGDTIQCVRYLPMIKNLGGTVVLECQKELLSLLKENLPIDTIIPPGTEKPHFDTYLPIMSLPRIFQTELDTIPTPDTYIHPLAKHPLDGLLAAEKGPFKVGLSWAGNKAHKNDANRSVNLKQLKPLLQTSSVKFYSLQYGERSGDIRNLSWEDAITDLSDHLQDFSDTAALIHQLDLIITVDTALAHLGGAMGKPTWILLPFSPDFRWLLHRNDSPWYNSVHLFRQPSPGDWDTVVDKLRAALTELVMTS